MLPYEVSGQAALILDVLGNTQAHLAPDPHLIIRVNDVVVSDERWDGQGRREVDATAPAGAIRAGKNGLQLAAPGDTGAMADIVALKSVCLSYARSLTAENDQIDFEAGDGTFVLPGISSESVEIYDVTDASEPRYLDNAIISSGTVSFGAKGGRTHHWIAVGHSAYKTIAQLTPMRGTDLHLRDPGADYLVVAFPEFVDALEPVLRWRSEHGPTVALVTTTDVHNEFGGSYRVSDSIAKFLRMVLDALEQARSSFCASGRQGELRLLGAYPWVKQEPRPNFLVQTPHLNQAASDNWYATSDTSGP